MQLRRRRRFLATSLRWTGETLSQHGCRLQKDAVNTIIDRTVVHLHPAGYYLPAGRSTLIRLPTPPRRSPTVEEPATNKTYRVNTCDDKAYRESTGGNEPNKDNTYGSKPDEENTCDNEANRESTCGNISNRENT